MIGLPAWLGDCRCFRLFSPLLYERTRALADPFKRHFETMKLLPAQFGEDSPHLRGVLSEGGNDEFLPERGEGDDPNAPVFRALDAAHQARREKTVHGNTDRTRGQIDDWVGLSASVPTGCFPTCRSVFTYRGPEGPTSLGKTVEVLCKGVSGYASRVVPIL